VELHDVQAPVRSDPAAVGVSVLSQQFAAARAGARKIYCSDGEDYAIEIDANATVLPSTDDEDQPDGHWVKAWVWVPTVEG